MSERPEIVAREPRIAAWVEQLPEYRGVARRWSDRADVAIPLVYLGVKLSDAGVYHDRLRDLERATDPPIAEYSRAADAWVFAAYGALDALAQVVVAAAGVGTEEEVKFPTLVRLLEGSGPGSDRWAGVGEYLAGVLEAEWFRELRRVRNLVNYRSVIETPGRWPPSGAVLDWTRTQECIRETIEHALSLITERK